MKHTFRIIMMAIMIVLLVGFVTQTDLSIDKNGNQNLSQDNSDKTELDATTALSVSDNNDKETEKIESVQQIEYIEKEEIVNEVKYIVIKKESNSLAKGETKTQQKGVNGYTKRSYQEKYIDGQFDSRTLVNEQIVKPIDEIILIGTYVKPQTNTNTTNQTTVSKNKSTSQTTTTPKTSEPISNIGVKFTDVSQSRRLFDLINEERKNAGLATLVWDQKLYDAAIIRAKEITVTFDHTRPNGTNFWTVSESANIYGENIGKRHVSPEKAHTAYMNSDGHRANILNPKYKRAATVFAVTADGYTYHVELFGK